MRAHNFSAGPAVLPLSVIEQLQSALPEFRNTPTWFDGDVT